MRFYDEKIIVHDAAEFTKIIPTRNSFYAIKDTNISFYRGGKVEDICIIIVDPPPVDGRKPELRILSPRSTRYNPNRKVLKEVENRYIKYGLVKLLVNFTNDEVVYDLANDEEISLFGVLPPVLSRGSKILGISTTKENPVGIPIALPNDFENMAGLKYFQRYSNRLIKNDKQPIEFGCKVLFFYLMKRFKLPESYGNGTYLSNLVNPTKSDTFPYMLDMVLLDKILLEEEEEEESKRHIAEENLKKLGEFATNKDLESYSLRYLVDNPEIVTEYNHAKTRVIVDLIINLPGDFPVIKEVFIRNKTIQFIAAGKYNDTKLTYMDLTNILSKALGIDHVYLFFEIDDDQDIFDQGRFF